MEEQLLMEERISAAAQEWWARVLAGETLTAGEHYRIAENLPAFAHRTALANPGVAGAAGDDEVRRAQVHALLAVAAKDGRLP